MLHQSASVIIKGACAQLIGRAGGRKQFKECRDAAQARIFRDGVLVSF